jgi:hypothetical protein
MNCFKHGFWLTTNAHCFGPRPVLQPPNGALGRTEARLRSFLLTAARRQRASRNGLLFDRINVWVGGWVGGGWVPKRRCPSGTNKAHETGGRVERHARVRVQCRQGRRQPLGGRGRRCRGLSAPGVKCYSDSTRAPTMAHSAGGPGAPGSGLSRSGTPPLAA